MMAPVADGVDVTRQTLALWIEPRTQAVEKGRAARFTVTVQNQGFEDTRVRVGGLSAPSRWMEPHDVTFDLSPHESRSYSLAITPPEGMPPGDYHFEITCIPEGAVGAYVSEAGKITLR